jgi:transcriptional regulator with XRE-family HTH domain
MGALDTVCRFGNALDMPRQKPPAARRPSNRIREWRKAAGLSLEELAHRVGSTNPTLSRYERGERSLTVDLLLQLAPHLKCRPADLLPDPESVLTEAERVLLTDFKELDPEDRNLVLRMARSLRDTARAAPVENGPPPRLVRRFN